MKTPLTISAITIVFSINAQVKKLNDLSDVLVEDSSLYVGHTPIYTNDAISNVAIGQTALSSITTGDFNTAIGQDALFWNDTGDKKYKSAYFEKYKNIWRHGDFAKITNIFTQRLDIALNIKYNTTDIIIH